MRVSNVTLSSPFPGCFLSVEHSCHPDRNTVYRRWTTIIHFMLQCSVFLSVFFVKFGCWPNPSLLDPNTFPRTQPNSFRGVAYPPTIYPLVTMKSFVLPSRLWVANSVKGLHGMSPISSSSRQRGTSIIPLCNSERWPG